MAPKPELKKAIAYEKIRASQWNDTFQAMLDYIEANNDELKLKVNTINSQLSTSVYNQLIENFKTMYPIGALYFGETDTCPLEELFGVWELVSQGRVIQGADDSHRPGTTVEAAIPNINATFTDNGHSGFARYSGAVSFVKDGTKSNSGEASNGGVYTFNASRSSSIYKDDCDTVQPPAYVVNIWKRTE